MSSINKIFKQQNFSIFHEFHKPPYGGGNQFLLALKKELESQGNKILNNKVNKRTVSLLFNSFNFDFDLLKEVKNEYKKIKMVHRVDGPISVYRGEDNADEDKKILELNHELADVTIFQSKFSLNKHIDMGLEFRNPVVITNASDPEIFNKMGKISPPDGKRKVRVIAASWSSNVNKGLETYKWLDENLNFEKFEFTFLGRIEAEFKNIVIVDPLPSLGVAQLLKQHDIYITASRNDPCSNSLIEALNCGLPSIYLNSGGHPEIVGTGGEGFTANEEILLKLEKVVQNYNTYAQNINVPSIGDVAKMYLQILKI